MSCCCYFLLRWRGLHWRDARAAAPRAADFRFLSCCQNPRVPPPNSQLTGALQKEAARRQGVNHVRGPHPSGPGQGTKAGGWHSEVGRRTPHSCARRRGPPQISMGQRDGGDRRQEQLVLECPCISGCRSKILPVVLYHCCARYECTSPCYMFPVAYVSCLQYRGTPVISPATACFLPPCSVSCLDRFLVLR